MDRKHKIDASQYDHLFVSHHTDIDDALQSAKPIRFVMGEDGIYKVMKNGVGTFMAKVDKVIGLKPIKEGVILNFPKVPYYMLLQTVTFFKEVMEKKNDAEAMVQFYWDPLGEKYIMYCPEQEITRASVRFLRSTEYDSKYTLVMDIHSHNTMGAFWSGTDNADEQETRVYGVLGKLDKDPFEYKFRISVGGQHRDIDIFDIFEHPYPKVSFPEEWMDRCKKPEPKVVTSNVSSGYSHVGTSKWRGGVRSLRELYSDQSFYTGYEGWGEDNIGKEDMPIVGSLTSWKLVGLDNSEISNLSMEDRKDIVRDLLSFDMDEIAAVIAEEKVQVEMIEAILSAKPPNLLGEEELSKLLHTFLIYDIELLANVIVEGGFYDDFITELQALHTFVRR